MHTEGLTRRSLRRKLRVALPVEKNEETHVITDLTNTTFPITIDDNWLEEDALKRDFPLMKRLSLLIRAVFTQTTELFLSFCPELPDRISEEVVRMSRDEPGGVAACRVRFHIVSNQSFVAVAEGLSQHSDHIPASLCLATTSLSEKSVVETFEVNVYLFPSTSVISKLQTIVTGLSLKKMSNNKESRLRNISLSPDFVLIKRKLFRSNNSKPLVVVNSIAK